MVLEEFANFISGICTRTPVAEGRPLLWTIITNPKAGGFSIKSRWKKHQAMLLECTRKAEMNPPRLNCGPSKTARSRGELGRLGLILTATPGHARKLTEEIVNEASGTASGGQGKPFYLIITAGGDGTSLEVMTGLYHAPAEIRRNFAILRLPMGTGNDGSDAFELDKALQFLIEPTVVKEQRSLKLITASGKGPFLAFNILSAGLDAFVTHMTNKMKGKLPGDSYKFWVDIAALFYDRIYKVGFLDIRSFDNLGREVNSFREKLLLLAVGESGKRCYGSRKWILPDERNVCALKQMPTLKKLALKGDFAKGKHVSRSEAILWNADRVEFSAQYPLLAQMDGETVLLTGEDFPAVIELSPPIIPILKLA